MADEVKLVDAKLLTTNIAQIAKNCARSDAQKALVGRILFMIDNMPTIEAEPVKHGRWIDTGSGQECSICKEIQYGYDNGRHYCPNCGARMDGDNNG